MLDQNFPIIPTLHIQCELLRHDPAFVFSLEQAYWLISESFSAWLVPLAIIGGTSKRAYRIRGGILSSVPFYLPLCWGWYIPYDRRMADLRGQNYV